MNHYAVPSRERLHVQYEYSTVRLCRAVIMYEYSYGTSTMSYILMCPTFGSMLPDMPAPCALSNWMRS